MSWKKYAAALKKIEVLQAELDELITERIHERAAEISGAPAKVMREMLENRSHGYCRCLALKKIADDGF